MILVFPELLVAASCIDFHKGEQALEHLPIPRNTEERHTLLKNPTRDVC